MQNPISDDDEDLINNLSGEESVDKDYYRPTSFEEAQILYQQLP